MRIKSGNLGPGITNPAEPGRILLDAPPVIEKQQENEPDWYNTWYDDEDEYNDHYLYPKRDKEK